MIDSLVSALDSARRSSILRQLGIRPAQYALLTLHRPSNVDDRERFTATLQAVAQIAEDIPVVFAVHPRTVSRVADLGITRTWDPMASIGNRGIWTMPPASYLDFLCLMDSAAFVMTDSGGVQEETTFLGVPCLTYRDNTERPVTVTNGTNRLIGTRPESLVAEARKVLGNARHGAGNGPPPLWDGHSAERIVGHIRRFFQTASAHAANG